MSNKQQLLCIRWQSEVRRWFSLRQVVYPLHEIADTGLSGEDERVALFLDSGDDVVVFFEGGRREEVGYEGFELLEVVAVVDLAAVHLSHQGADHVPGEFLGCDVGPALRDRFDPVIDDKCRAFVLLRSC